MLRVLICIGAERRAGNHPGMRDAFKNRRHDAHIRLPRKACLSTQGHTEVGALAGTLSIQTRCPTYKPFWALLCMYLNRDNIPVYTPRAVGVLRSF